MSKKGAIIPEPVLQHKCILGEGPLWDSERSTICWVDIIAGEIHQFNTITSIHTRLSVQQMIGCICLCKNGNFIAGLKNGIGIIDRKSGNIEMIAHPEKHLPGNRFNDGRCDPSGRFWAGTMALTEEEGAGNLYMMNHQGEVSKKIVGVSISNGLAWSNDHKILYYIDTPTQKVAAYDFNIATGAISNKRFVIEIPGEDGFPDGMTIDSEGLLWIAHWGGWQISRWDPKTSTKLSNVTIPVSKVTSCTFGGETLEDLYITTASRDLTDEELKQQPLAGCLFVVKNCGFKGTKPFEFSGIIS